MTESNPFEHERPMPPDQHKLDPTGTVSAVVDLEYSYPTPKATTFFAEVDPQPEGQAPVAGYTKQPPEKIILVNAIKEAENRLGDLLVELQGRDDVDGRMVALARTNLQQGFMWLVRGIFQPESRL